ncbi:MAG: decarboxylating NADP(+)-dependent phosphogluconate dehydrogenase [Verrucomicrobiota bacterium]
MSEPTGDIALIGLAVMGQNFILNMNDHGFKVIAHNRTTAKIDRFLENEAKGSEVEGAWSIEEMVAKLKKPRRVMMLVKAGPAVDAFIEKIVPHLEAGDIIIDGGNSHYPDSQRRMLELENKGLLFVGTGISGGEDGARHGPSLMPGGSPEAWPHIKEIFQQSAAKAPDGSPCCDWVGKGGAGHFVKMVHNGIEYGDMQLICEGYDLMHRGLGMDNGEISDVFEEWNKGELDSFLIEITTNILRFKQDGGYLVDSILDAAGQKGTGKWTAEAALDKGQPVNLITEAVYARALSALKEERVAASKVLSGPKPEFKGNKEEFVENIRQALYASKIVSYAQGYMLMRAASQEYGWDLNYGGIALMWRGGCIIRSVFLGEIKKAYDKNPELENLLLDDFFHHAIDECQASWRKVVAEAASLGIPVPAYSSALSFYDGYRAERLPANLLQAQRDYFGAHTYERVDRPRGEFTHTNWTGHGGDVSSSTYNA